MCCCVTALAGGARKQQGRFPPGRRPGPWPRARLNGWSYPPQSPHLVCPFHPSDTHDPGRYCALSTPPAANPANRNYLYIFVLIVLYRACTSEPLRATNHNASHCRHTCGAIHLSQEGKHMISVSRPVLLRVQEKCGHIRCITSKYSMFSKSYICHEKTYSWPFSS